MIGMALFSNARLRCSVALGAFLQCGGFAQVVHAEAVCTTQAGCLDSILDAARAGRQSDGIALMAELQRLHRASAGRSSGSQPLPPRIGEALGVGDPDAALQQIQRNVATVLGKLPDYRRGTALGYLRNGDIDGALRFEEDNIGDDPVYAPFWMDLAVLYARQNQHERAVAALIVADAWAGDQTALRQAYHQAAQDAPASGMRAAFAAALQRIEAIETQQAQAEQALAPVDMKGAATDPSRKPAVVDLHTCTMPEYPYGALRYEDTGTVKLRFLVAADGSVRRMRKSVSSGHPQLDNAAAFALARCSFRPATVDGKPVATWQAVEYVWQLE
jgi:TonB family protein